MELSNELDEALSDSDCPGAILEVLLVILLCVISSQSSDKGLASDTTDVSDIGLVLALGGSSVDAIRSPFRGLFTTLNSCNSTRRLWFSLRFPNRHRFLCRR